MSDFSFKGWTLVSTYHKRDRITLHFRFNLVIARLISSKMPLSLDRSRMQSFWVGLMTYTQWETSQPLVSSLKQTTLWPYDMRTSHRTNLQKHKQLKQCSFVCHHVLCMETHALAKRPQTHQEITHGLVWSRYWLLLSFYILYPAVQPNCSRPVWCHATVQCFTKAVSTTDLFHVFFDT